MWEAVIFWILAFLAGAVFVALLWTVGVASSRKAVSEELDARGIKRRE